MARDDTVGLAEQGASVVGFPHACVGIGFALQSDMDSNWAAEHLQTIRTLMERTALYRRALAPIMIVAGSIGIVGATIPCFTPIQSSRAFCAYWLLVSCAALIASFLFARRQALKDREPFWSPPTRRVTQALLPCFFVGLVTGLICIAFEPRPAVTWLLSLFWTALYGFALHSAGFFMQRGIKVFAWILIVGATTTLASILAVPPWQSTSTAHYVMGTFFGVIHLAYGVYLYFTEKRTKPL